MIVWCETCWEQTEHNSQQIEDNEFWCCINCGTGILKNEVLYRLDMFSMKNNPFGEHSSVGEELLSGISEVEEKSRAVYMAVKDNYFTLEEALALYKISNEDYQIFLNKFENN